MDRYFYLREANISQRPLLLLASLKKGEHKYLRFTAAIYLQFHGFLRVTFLKNRQPAAGSLNKSPYQDDTTRWWLSWRLHKVSTIMKMSEKIGRMRGRSWPRRSNYWSSNLKRSVSEKFHYQNGRQWKSRRGDPRRVRLCQVSPQSSRTGPDSPENAGICGSVNKDFVNSGRSVIKIAPKAPWAAIKSAQFTPPQASDRV